MEIKEFFELHPEVAVACSGGVDSTFLLYEACRYAERVKAYFVKSAFQPEFEMKDAVDFCSGIGAELQVINADVLSDGDVAANPSNRCYYCKKKIFGTIMAAAEKDGFTALLEGTNASDDIEDRPGFRAITELGVFSPLRDCGFTKKMIREESKKAGLPLFDKPAYACLATRIPAGTAIDAETLSRVEEAEGLLFDRGYSDFRVRVFHGAARIQLNKTQVEKFMAEYGEIAEEMKKYFSTVLLDLGVNR